MAESYAEYLKALLRPLGIYDLTAGTANESELYAWGAGLDALSGQLERVERESLTATALEEGLRRREELFARCPAAVSPQQRREAIGALMQIDGDSFTLDAMNQTLGGCGIRAEAVEVRTPGYLRVIFPEVAGKPAEFERIQSIISDILPCHLEVEFYFRYLTWKECEERLITWAAVESAEHTWHSFELWV